MGQGCLEGDCVAESHCGTLVFVDVPPHSAIGVDQYVYTVGESFKGIKHVPCGTHVVSYAAYGAAQNQYGPVTAMFVTVPKVVRRDDDQCAGMEHDAAWMMDSAFHGPVIGWRWDKEEEILVGMNDEEHSRAEGMVRSLAWDRELGSYMALGSKICSHPQVDSISWNSYREWVGLSEYLDDNVLKRLVPKEGNICVIAEGDPSSMLGKQMKKNDAEIALDEQLKHSTNEGPMPQATHAGRCRFTSLPDVLIKDKNLSPSDLTMWNMDKSKVLESLLHEQYANDENLFLGELQFSFLAFLLGHSLEAFMQWKHLLGLLFGCDDAVTTGRIELFVKSLEVILHQFTFIFGRSSGGEEFSQVSRDTISEQFLEDSFLKTVCISFIQSILYESECTVDRRIERVVLELEKLLSSALSWDCGPVVDLEDGPVVVEM